MLLLEVVRALRKHRVEYAIAGGYAVALHGAVRGTVDLDLVLAHSQENYEAAERALRSLGLRSRLPVSAAEVFQFREEYLENRNLAAWAFYDPKDPTRLVDIVIAYAEAKVRFEEVRVQKELIRILARADLIAMKEATGREQDLEDVRALRRLS